MLASSTRGWEYPLIAGSSLASSASWSETRYYYCQFHKATRSVDWVNPPHAAGLFVAGAVWGMFLLFKASYLARWANPRAYKLGDDDSRGDGFSIEGRLRCGPLVSELIYPDLQRSFIHINLDSLTDKARRSVYIRVLIISSRRWHDSVIGAHKDDIGLVNCRAVRVRWITSELRGFPGRPHILWAKPLV